MKIHSLKALLVPALFTLLAACSSKDINEPSKLIPVDSPIKINKLWDVSVGTGDDELSLRLVPAFVQNVAYLVDVDGELTAFDVAAGKELWDIELNEQVSAGLGTSGQHLFYVTFQGELVCLDIENGSELWRQKLTSEGVSAPVSNGTLVATQTIDGKVFAFNVAQGIKRWQFDSVGPLLSLRGTASPLLTSDKTYVSFANGEMTAIDNQNGFPLWKADVGVPQGRTELERLVDVDGDAIIDRGVIFAVAYQGKLVALDSYTGREIWNKPVSSYGGVALSNAKVYVTNDDGEVVAHDSLTGERVWVNDELKYRRLSTPTAWGDFIVTADLDGYIHVIDTETGAIKGRMRPDWDGVMHMQSDDDLLYVYSRSGDFIAYQLPSSTDKQSK